MNTKKTLLNTCLITLVGAAATAQVALESTIFSYSEAPGTYQDPLTYVNSFTVDAATISGQSFSAAGNDKLVLVLSTKSSDSAGGAATSISYNGISLTSAQQQTSGLAQHSIWYLDNVASDGDLSVSLDAGIEGWALRMFALDGTAAGVQDVAHNEDINTLPTLTTTTASSFLVYDASRNFGGLSYGGSQFDSDYYSYGGRGRSLALWDVPTTSGNFSDTISGMNGSGGIIGASFEAVPEPSAALLIGGLGVLTLLRRRR